MPEMSDAWSGILHDASALRYSGVGVAQVASEHAERDASALTLVDSLVLTDEQLPQLRTHPASSPISIVVSGGAGAIAGACRLAGKVPDLTMHGLRITLRDLDDLPGNARRVTTAVDQAQAEGLLAADIPVYVELPLTGSTSGGFPGLGHGWLGAADEVAALEHRLALRIGADAQQVPDSPTVAAWIDAALDRELPFVCTGDHRWVTRRAESDRQGDDQHGLVNVLLATVAAFDGAASEEVVGLLAEHDVDSLVHAAAEADLNRARRWCTGFDSTSVAGVLEELTAQRLLGS